MKKPDGFEKDDDVSGFRETARRFLFLFVVEIVVELGGTLGGSTASHM